ncbi:Disease resistance protein [Citrus sinensis]|nr:Disease resistance protein [Citrus sinensis]
MAIEACLAFLTNVVSEGAKSLFKPITRQISYVFKYQSYIDGLKVQVKQLGHQRERVEIPVHQATQQGDEIYKDVADWLHSVDEFISEGVAKSIIDDEDSAKKSCFKGLCPNLISRYKLSKQAEKAAEAADNLVGSGNFSNVSHRPTPKLVEHMQVKDFEAFGSRMKVFQDVVEALKDYKLNIIGVYGMGGVGKTTLVKQVAKQVMEDKLFDKVAMAEVTENPDHQKIQDKLASDLGIKFELNESIFDRANRLHGVLKNKERHLIILDNIWRELEFDKVGIPSGDVEKERMDDQRRCTIILTSRRQDLLRNVLNSQKEIQIDALSKEEALQLFGKIVCNSAKASAFQPLADEIVEKCGGLPVALITLAKALKNERLDTWKDVQRQLRSSNAKEIDGMERNVYISIKLSYDLLGSKEAKSLFLLCGLYNEGRAIPVPYLLRYGMGMGYFKNVCTLEEARSRVHTLIGKLKSSCLLLDGDAEDEVKMHDIIHAVAVSIAEEELMFNIPNVAYVEKKMEETIREGPIAISLPYRDIQELPERLGCPRLELLLLFSKRDSSLQISDLFFQGTEELKVLDLAGIHFSSLPSSLGRLINLQTLCLDGCRLNEITIIGQLRKLEILSFRDSDVKELPLVIGQLTRLQLLDLTNCWSLVVIAPNVISKLSRLEELYICNSFSQWEKVEGGSNASLAELNGLSKLTTLEIHVRDAEILPQDLVSVELQSYRICIGNKWWGSWSVKSGLSRLMKLQGLVKFGILLQNYRMKLLLKRTEYLYLEELKGVQNVVHELDDGEGFPRLKHLSVESCSEILHIVGSVGRVRRKVFPLLESLSLIDLNNLETICDSQLTEDQSFSNLRIIKVRNCQKLKQLFSFSIARNLLRLQKVKVAYCNKLEMIVGHVGEEVKENRIAFSELKVLILDYLPRLTSFCLENYTLEFPSLERVSVTLCPDMKTFSQGILSTPKLYKVQTAFRDIKHLQLSHFPRLQEIWHGQALPVSFFNNLFKLVVDDCTNMSSAIPANLLRCLNNLEYLQVRNCDSLEEALHLEELSAKEEHIGPPFPRLFSLRLIDLPKLKRFCNFIENIIEMPKLEYLTIENCPDMETFVSNSVVYVTTDNKEPQKLKSEENLFVADQIQHLFDEKVAFPQLMKLKLSGLHKVQHLWKENAESNKVFANLKSLEISECSKLQKLVPTSWHLENLKALKVSKCHRLINVLTFSTSESLVNLERMKIIDCKMIEEIIQSQAGEEAKDCIVFRKLKYLGLDCLPSLTSFCLGNYALEFPSLKRAVVRQCPKMKILDTPMLNKVNVTEEEKDDDEEDDVAFPQLRWLELSRLPNVLCLWKENAESNKVFANLGSLKISECSKLQKLVPPSWHLENLQRMKIADCKRIEEIIQSPVAEEAKDCIVFKKLKYLGLDCLPSLTSFCLGNYALEFPSLKQVVVRQCPKMKIFSQGLLDTPMLNKVNVTEEEKDDDDEGCWEGNLNDTIKKLFNEMVSIN